MANTALDAKPYAGNPHVRIDEGDGASAKPRRSSLLYKERRKKNSLMTLLGLVLIGMIFESQATSGIAGKPNFIEGGFTYCYMTEQGNISDADWDALKGYPAGTTTNNVYGRIPKTVVDYYPPMGKTNVIYLSRTDSFSVPTNCVFHGKHSYDDARVTGPNLADSQANQDYLLWDVVDGRTVFKAANATPVDTTFGGVCWWSCYFTQMNTNVAPAVKEFARLDVCLVNRSDAFYRVPLNDTYYVAPNTPLWFRTYSDATSVAAPSPWRRNGGTNWTLTTEDNYDKFTITASVGTTFHITSEDGLRDITVHVVDPAVFSFDKYILYFDGTNEVRRLSTILYECGTDYTIADVSSVITADPGEIEVVQLASGDWTIQARDYFDVDRELTVTLKNGSVILLKITSMTGRSDESLCASVFPKIIHGNFTKVLTDDNGSPCPQPLWEKTTKTDNAPPGYTNVMRVLNAVLYKGKRYSVYIACQTPDFAFDVPRTDTTELASPANGVLWCVKSLRKIVCWLEDENGRHFVTPNLCLANSGDYNTHPSRFCLGTGNVLYTNAEPSYQAKGGSPSGRLLLTPYVGTEIDEQTGLLFQGVTPDVYGYYAILANAEWLYDFAYPNDWYQYGVYLPEIIPFYDEDELTVFEVQDVRTVTVSKEAIGGLPDERFLFEAVYLDCERSLVTNRFSLASGEAQRLMVTTGGVVRVTEVPREGYAASVRMDRRGGFVAGSALALDDVWDDHLFEFRNVSDNIVNPVSLWITDHEDAGANHVHLAFEPHFERSGVSLTSWLEGARQRDAVHIVFSESAEGLKTAPLQPIRFRDAKGPIDPDHPSWVWITANAPELGMNQIRHCQITIDQEQGKPGYSGYYDEVLCTSVASNQIKRVKVDDKTDAYVFSNIWEMADIQINRKSRVKSILLVGGGGAGGGTTGGGGAGGEVRLLGPEEFGAALENGTTLNVSVGAGGAPAQVDSAVYSEYSAASDYKIDVPSHTPGRSGGETVVRIGNRQFTAAGGGGGGSFKSTYPGAMNPHGQGLPGGNGGGSGSCSAIGDFAATGGAAAVQDGHVGGGAYAGILKGAGGGGGMSTAGGNGTVNQSGNGGEGVTLTLARLTGVYGAGGGGGGNASVAPGVGGTNAGRGGSYTAGSYTAANFPSSALGGDGANGFGAGGGGGAYLDDGLLACRGGHGGDGTVIIVLEDASIIDASVVAKDIQYTSATLQATVAALGSAGDTVTVSYAYARQGETMPALQPVSGGTALQAGDVVNVPLEGLVAGTSYDFVFAFENAGGYRLNVDGNFTTTRMYERIAYQDEYIVVEGDPNASPLSKLPSGEYLLVWNTACANTRMRALQNLTFTRGILVGGGGAGGSSGGGGGGGGGVTVLDSPETIPAGTELYVTVGAGGVVVGSGADARNENGGTSTLTIGANTRQALGGGAGASYSTRIGWNGANGGGGMTSAGTGGRSTDATGFAGGKGYSYAFPGLEWLGSFECGGGGGGAGEVGQDGGFDVSQNKGKSGNGGEGIASDITGTSIVYGSGGGAGSGNAQYVEAGIGGTNAGDGAVDGNGTSGTSGRGGGGGGASRGFSGGAGGCGAVILRFMASLP